MSLTNLEKTPWPWFGGKADAAESVWHALGDCAHYVEPFAGSLAVLLRRPHPANRTYYSETVNDLDGLLVNAWRSIQWSPEATADAASWPVSEADLHARHIALLRWREERQLEHLMGDPRWHDPIMAGWWMWGQSCWIGSGWCSGRGAWTADDSGRIHKQTREPGVSRQRPHLTNNGQGVNHAGTREPGVSRKRPHLADDGQGVNRPQAREPGVSRQLPHLANDGRGVTRPQTREPGVGGYHPMTMPELRRWMGFLSARLRHVRILNGDWRRALTNGASLTLPVRMKPGQHCGIFLDPPYADTASRASDLYTHDCEQVAHAVRDWALTEGDDPRKRIVIAGYSGEHGGAFEAAGWRAVEWYRSGFLKGGMTNTGANATQQDRERLWLSPHCVGVAAPKQVALWGAK